MKYSIAFLAAVAAVQASPVPQGVTAKLAPTASAPPGCMPSYSGTFGVVVQNITAGGSASVTQKADVSSTASSGHRGTLTSHQGQPNANSAKVTQIADGQVQASTAAAVSQIPDGQIQAATDVSVAPVNQISDGQIQATGRMTMHPVTQIADGQIQATYMAPVTQISDGQIQASAMPVSQIADGQPQAANTAAPVSQIADGQPQAANTAAPVSQIADGQPQAATSAAPVSQIADGQPQAANTAAPVSQIADGQPQAATTAGAVSQIADGQVQASSAVSQIADGQVQASATGSSSAANSASPQMVACKGDGVLSLTLDNGVLLDDQGRTGYIASNYQFQFDKPAQAGAIYTSGWSVCGNGSLALGGSTTFYQCLSGNFYNLYDRHWAAQCNAVTIDLLELMNCDS